MIIEIKPQDHPNELGEILRKKFFKKELGCYSCFSLREDVIEYPNYIDADGNSWTCAKLRVTGNEVVEMRYFWDGDGTLAFLFQDGRHIENIDCKKTHGWVYYEGNFDYLHDSSD